MDYSGGSAGHAGGGAGESGKAPRRGSRPLTLAGQTGISVYLRPDVIRKGEAMLVGFGWYHTGLFAHDEEDARDIAANPGRWRRAPGDVTFKPVEENHAD